MKTNTATNRRAGTFRTHEGAPAIQPKHPIDQLRRAVSACLLWEDQFYEDGATIGDRIRDLTKQCEVADVAALAVQAREDLKLRHAPLWLLTCLALDGRAATAETYERVIQRADEPGELIAMFWKDGRRPLPNAMKRGIALAMRKFDAYQLAKYDRKVDIRLRDVMRLTHPKPDGDEQSAMWKALIAGELPSPDTWEVALSGGADKGETFTRLIQEGRLGYMALLRNLRNMDQAGVNREIVDDAIRARKGAGRVLPFRFLSATRAAPGHDAALDEAMLAAIDQTTPLPGRTVVCVDCSGSMGAALSQRSTVTRLDAAASLAALVNGDVRVVAFGQIAKEVAARKGLAGIDAIRAADVGHATNIAEALRVADKVGHDRVIIVTDEQSATPVGPPAQGSTGYIINVASYQNGIGYGPWVRLNGFSESTIRWVRQHEGLD